MLYDASWIQSATFYSCLGENILLGYLLRQEFHCIKHRLLDIERKYINAANRVCSPTPSMKIPVYRQIALYLYSLHCYQKWRAFALARFNILPLFLGNFIWHHMPKDAAHAGRDPSNYSPILPSLFLSWWDASKTSSPHFADRVVVLSFSFTNEEPSNSNQLLQVLLGTMQL